MELDRDRTLNKHTLPQPGSPQMSKWLWLRRRTPRSDCVSLPPISVSSMESFTWNSPYS